MSIGRLNANIAMALRVMLSKKRYSSEICLQKEIIAKGIASSIGEMNCRRDVEIIKSAELHTV